MTRRPVSGGRLLEAVILLFLSAAVVRGATFLVTNTNDSGGGSLRQAILEANFLGGQDVIAFQIPGPGPYVIAPLSQLPTITDPTIVDGQTQPGYSSGSRIELSGASAGLGVDGLVVTGPTSVIVGLVIRGFQPAFLSGGGNGVVLQGGGGSILLGNRIGTDLSGLAASGNGANGVLVSDSPNNRIGPSSAGEPRNLISGNGTGVRIVGSNSDSNLVAGNFIGTDVNGTGPLGNVGDGVAILAGSGNVVYSTTSVQVISANSGNGVTIAGTATSTSIAGNRIGTDVTGTVDLGNVSDGVEVSGASFSLVGLGNLISGNNANGVLLIGGATDNAVGGNFIGTNAGGTAALPNSGNGVIVSGANGNRIGGVSGEGNLISGNGTNGVRIRSGASGNRVLGNRIGVNHAGTGVIPNVEHGVQLNDGAVTSNVVGGPLAGEGNLIQGNGLNGVFVTDPTTIGSTIQRNTIWQNGANGIAVQAGTNHRITENSVSANGTLGIDLGADGVTPNDSMDADPGANDQQNFPVLTRAGGSSADATLHSAPSTSYVVEFFSSPQCDPSGHGEGATFVGSTSVMTDAGGNVSFSVGFIGPAFLGHFVTATATDPVGNSSEFSLCIPVSARFHTLPPCRVKDTRDDLSPLMGGDTRVFPIAGNCGVPASARAVALNLTVADPTAQGHLTLYSEDATLPPVSTINYRFGQTRANNAIVTLGQFGGIYVAAGQPSGTVHVILDVVGYFE